jgi:hypothetical protein
LATRASSWRRHWGSGGGTVSLGLSRRPGVGYIGSGLFGGLSRRSVALSRWAPLGGLCPGQLSSEAQCPASPYASKSILSTNPPARISGIISKMPTRLCSLLPLFAAPFHFMLNLYTLLILSVVYYSYSTYYSILGIFSIIPLQKRNQGVSVLGIILKKRRLGGKVSTCRHYI